MRRKRLPPRHLWPRKIQRASTRRRCEKCGTLDRAVSTRGTISYYGPAKCDHCGAIRGLRKVERPIDWERIALLYVIPIELLRSLPREVVKRIRDVRLSCSHGQEETREDNQPASSRDEAAA